MFAQHNLGRMYHAGEGTVRNARKALKWIRLSAKSGYEDAKRALGELFIGGDGDFVDAAIAAEHLRLSEEPTDKMLLMLLEMSVRSNMPLPLGKKGKPTAKRKSSANRKKK
jgi:TPR repeat protein